MTIKPCVLILGMHRSGTSSLAGSLQQNGLYLGAVAESNPHNLKGNRENSRIMLLNDAVLARNSATWRSPPETITWDAELANERDEIIKNFNSDTCTIWGFKDPRTLLTLPFWRDGLDNIQIIGTFRHPVSVAKSLVSRNNMSFRDGLDLWFSYNTRLLTVLQEKEFPIACFDVSLLEYMKSIELMLEVLGLEQKTDKDAIPFFDDSMRKEDFSKNAEISQQENDLYQKLIFYYNNFRGNADVIPD